MTIETFSQSYSGWNRSVEIHYPPGCLPDSYDDDWNPQFKHEGTKYLTEHRAYPGKENLLNSLTPRELVYTAHSEMGKQYRSVWSNCPHGTHGQVETRYYYSSLAPFTGMIDMDYTRLKDRKIWSDALRRKLVSNRVNLSSSVAEYRESCKLFHRLALKFRDVYRILKLKDVGKLVGRRRTKVTIGAIPASILQYNFGIAPLVSDTFSVIEALRLKLTAPILCRTSASVRIRREGHQFTTADFEHNLTDTFQQRATIYYDMDPSQYVSEYIDLGNPAEWIWESIPFSFMIDGAISIGSWLNGLDALTGISNIRGTVVTKVKQRTKYRWSQATSNKRAFTSYYNTYERSVISSVPITLPRWNPSSGWRKVLNASSILATLRINAGKFSTSFAGLKLK